MIFFKKAPSPPCGNFKKLIGEHAIHSAYNQMVSKGGIEIFSMGIFSLLVKVSSKLTLTLNKYHRIQCYVNSTYV